MGGETILDHVKGVWMALAYVSEDSRQRDMLKVYEELVDSSEEERCQVVQKLAEGEYKLPDDKLRTFTRSKLLTWLKMSVEKARIIANAYDQVIKKMPATAAMKRVATVQTVARNLPSDQLERLQKILPPIVLEVPSRAKLSRSLGMRGEEKKGRKSWWQFWKAG